MTVTYLGRSSPLKDGYLLYGEACEQMLTSEAVIFVIKLSIVWGKLIDVHELTVCVWYWYMCVYAFMACTRWPTCVSPFCSHMLVSGHLPLRLERKESGQAPTLY